jgi:hypothetical protein
MIDTTTNVATTHVQPLSEFHLEMLSANAAKLYEAVWSRMASKNVSEIWMDDTEASRRSRVALQFIGAAQSELARSGLFAMTPGLRQVKYEFVSDPDAEIEAEV